MAWFKVDDGFANSKPVLRIPRRHRTQAVGLWILAGTWCAKELTDGFVPDYLLEELASTPAIANLLVAAGLWERVEGGYQFVGWDKYQPTKSQVLASRAEEAERKQKARDAAVARRLAAQTGSRPENVRPDESRTPPGQSPESALPDPTRPDPTRPLLSLVTSGGDVALVDAHEPPRRCDFHIIDPNPPRCGRCADARKTHDEWTRLQTGKRKQQAAERRAAIDACTECDDHGMIEQPGGLDHCTHQAAANA